MPTASVTIAASGTAGARRRLRSAKRMACSSVLMRKVLQGSARLCKALGLLHSEQGGRVVATNFLAHSLVDIPPRNRVDHQRNAADLMWIIAAGENPIMS